MKPTKKTKPSSPKTSIAIGTYVVVATSSRPWSVAAGYYAGEDKQGRVYLDNARQIIYWSSPSHGLLGVAARGIVDGDGRVSPAVRHMRVKNEESVIAATDLARTSIEAEPWK